MCGVVPNHDAELAKARAAPSWASGSGAERRVARFIAPSSPSCHCHLADDGASGEAGQAGRLLRTFSPQLPLGGDETLVTATV